MKKLASITIMLILLLGLFTGVQAAYIEELKMNIDIPEGYIEVLKAIEDKDAFADKISTELGMSGEELTSQLKKNNVIKDYMTEDFGKEIVIGKIENATTKAIKNLKSLSESDLQTFISQYKTAKTALKMTVKKQDTFEKDGVLYIHAVLDQKLANGSTMQSTEYYTVVNGAAVDIVMNYVKDEFNEEELTNVVNTIKFDEVKDSNKKTDSNSESSTNYALIGAIGGIIAVVVIVFVVVKMKKK